MDKNWIVVGAKRQTSHCFQLLELKYCTLGEHVLKSYKDTYEHRYLVLEYTGQSDWDPKKPTTFQAQSHNYKGISGIYLQLNNPHLFLCYWY